MKVMVFGTFDTLHPGHLFLLSEAQKRGTVYAVVAQNSTVETIKGKTPLQSLEHRMAAITQQYPNIIVVPGHLQDYAQPIRAHAPDLLLFGYDQKLPPGLEMEHITIPFERLPAYKPHIWKSSKLRKALSE